MRFPVLALAVLLAAATTIASAQDTVGVAPLTLAEAMCIAEPGAHTPKHGGAIVEVKNGLEPPAAPRVSPRSQRGELTDKEVKS